MKFGKNTESKHPKLEKIKSGRIMLLSKCAVYDSKKSIFIKDQEARGLSKLKVLILSDLPIANPLF